MRILDLLHPYLGGVRRVVDLSAGTLKLGPYLHLSAGSEAVDYLPPGGDPGGEFGAGDLVLAVVGTSAETHGSEDDALRALDRLRRGARAMVLFEQSGLDLAYHRVLEKLVERHCQVLQVAGIELRALRSGLMVECVDQPQMPRSYYGEPAPGDDVVANNGLASGAVAQLRLCNEYVLSDYVARAVRAHMLDLEAQRRVVESRMAEAADGRRRLEDLQRHAGELTRELREAHSRLSRAERRIQQLEESVSLHVGRLLTGAARSPGRSFRLPGQLYRVWKASSQAGARGDRKPASQPRLGEKQRHISESAHIGIAIGPRDRMVITGVIHPETAAALAPDCLVNPVTPNDAVLTVERTAPDLVLIEAAALQAGQLWAHAATGHSPERDIALFELIDAGRAASRPVVLWRNVAHAELPGLGRLAERCDVVLHDGQRAAGTPTWSRGVQLAHHHPTGFPGDRSAAPVHVGAWGRREPPAARQAAIRALDSLLPTGLDLYLDPWDAAGAELVPPQLRAVVAGALPGTGADIYRRSAVLVADPFVARPSNEPGDRTIEQIACGARVVAASSGAFGGRLGMAVVPIGDAAACRAAVQAAVEAGPPSPGELRSLLREIFLRHSVAARLDRLARVLGLPVDPLAGRQVSAVACLRGDADAVAFSGALLAQAHRPVEAVVASPAGDGVDASLRELADAGIRVVAIRPADSSDSLDCGPARWAELTVRASAPWLALWTPERRWPANHLLDLLVGAEISRADAVGLAAGQELVFTASLTSEAALVGAEAARRYGLPGSTGPGLGSAASFAGWARQGARMFALDAGLTGAGRVGAGPIDGERADAGLAGKAARR
jgi:hypothetical protein